jgi:hypothetical protein
MSMMPLSKFSIVQYVPNPTSGERVNVGVVILSPEAKFASVRFDGATRRAQRIAPSGSDLKFLKQLQTDLEARMPQARGQQKWLGDIVPLSADELERLYRESGNTIQFSEPLASTADPEELEARLIRTYLPALRSTSRGRSDLAVRRNVKRVMESAGLDNLIQSNYRIRGRHDSYTFDFALVNGTPKKIIETKSLEKDDREATRSDIHATGYRIRDLRDNGIQTPVSLVVSSGGNELFDLASRVMDDLGGEVVVEDRAAHWAESLAHRLLRRQSRGGALATAT